MTEREVMQTLNTLWEAGIRWDLPWKLSDSDDRRYVTRRAQKAAYDHNHKGA